MKTLAQLLCALPQARPVGEVGAADIHRVHTDTRSLRAGDLFVALRGERFDAHDFLPQAAAAGAVAALAEQGLRFAGADAVRPPLQGATLHKGEHRQRMRRHRDPLGLRGAQHRAGPHPARWS